MHPLFIENLGAYPCEQLNSWKDLSPLDTLDFKEKRGIIWKKLVKTSKIISIYATHLYSKNGMICAMWI